MNRIFKICLFCILLLTISINGYAKIGYSSLSQLVHEAPYIAKGTISVENDTVILDIEKMLKGENYSKLLISFEHDPEAPDPIFNNGEEVILFLHIPDFSQGYYNYPGLPPIPMPTVQDGEMYLFGLGDQAKWPKRYSGKYKFLPYPKLQDTASIEEIQDVIEKLLIIEDANNIDEKVILCTEYIKSSYKVLQYTAMEYALYGGIWADPNKVFSGYVSYRPTKKVKDILNKLTDEVVKLNLINDDEPTIRSEAVRFLGFSEPYEYLPLLIPKITDSNRLVRSNTRVILNQFALNQKVTGDFTNFKPEDSIENLQEIQKEWNDWWEQNRDKFIKKNN